MALVTLDFETPFSSGKVNPEKFSLGDLTYEEYISDERFWPYGVGIGFGLDEPIWYDFDNSNLEQVLQETFPPGNDHSMIAHNNMFDAAILNWHYGLSAQRYYCTMMMSKGLWRFESASLANLAKRLWPMNDERRKGKELAVADGLFDPMEFTREILDYVGGYCEQDCRLTTLAFIDMMSEFPEDELDVIDDTIRMFVERPLKLNRPLVLDYQRTLNAEREEAFRNSGYPRDILASPDKFVKMLREDHDIEIEKVPSPTLKNPKNKKWPLAKNDVSFIKLRQSRPDLDHLWEGRIAAASNQEPTRCERFLTHGAVGEWNPEGRIAIPLNYCGANTTRFSGTNSINMQNLGRKSKLRDALTAKDGHMLIISDLSGIENRFNADHAQAFWKLKAFADKRDLYNELATDVFGYPVDRKAKDENDNKLFAGEWALGKTAELGLGYGMGVNKFVLTCHQGPMGEPPMLWVDEELGHRTVSTWRNKNAEIVNSWHMADNFLEIMAQPMEKPIQWGSVEMCYQGIRLPSGLYIQYPRLRYDKSMFKNDDGSDRWTWQYWVNVGRNGFWKDIWGGTCISRDTPVITQRGPIAIQDISPADKIWDGIEWVSHDGVIDKGTKEVMNAYGVWMTPDHEVLTNDGWKPASESERFNRAHCELPDSFELPYNQETQSHMERILRWLQQNLSNGRHRIPKTIEEKRPKFMRVHEIDVSKRKQGYTQNVKTPGIRRLAQYARSLPLRFSSRIRQLRWSWNLSLRTVEQFPKLLGGYGGQLPTGFNLGSNRQQRGVFAEQLPLGRLYGPSKQPTKLGKNPGEDDNPNLQRNRVKAHDGALSSQPRMVGRPTHNSARFSQPVYDILNCGPRNRFAVLDENNEPLIVHNCIENIIQGISRVKLTDVQRAVKRRFAEAGIDGLVVLQVHDELVFSAQKDAIEDALGIVEEEMRRRPSWASEYLILDCESEVSPHYVKP